MGKIKGWEKVKMRGLVSNTWWLSDGVEIDSYGMKTKYPFIQVSEDRSSTKKNYGVKLVTTHQTIKLPKVKYNSQYPYMNKEQAIKVAVNYMRSHPNG